MCESVSCSEMGSGLIIDTPDDWILPKDSKSIWARVEKRTVRGISERNPETFRGGSGENRWKRNSPEPKTMKSQFR
jgi:hypothetical protein